MTTGRLYVVATPIGNLADITLRALRVLGEVDVIAAEDTRTTRKLLAHHGIRTPLVSYHEHNESLRTPELLGRLQAGESVALVSEAGTPLISDPGYRLVQLAIAQGITVVPIPGPAAVVAAITVAGLPTDRFVFEGFLPKKPGKRRKRLENLQGEPRTLIFYESPRRVYDVLGDMQALFEEILRGRITEVRAQLEERPPRGEVTLVVEGAISEVRPPTSRGPDDPPDLC
jgi:16S rRNA (cytidine1402-2'-O)-methyltransferase